MSVSADTFCVDPGRIDEIWPHVLGWLQTATEKCGDWTVDVIRDALLSEEMLLWVRWDGTALRAATVTELMTVPRGKVCQIVVCGGEKVGSWQEAIAPIEKYASEQGCVAMRIHGRIAWTKIFPDYDLEWVALEKRLN